MIRFIATDMDGTLLEPGGTLPDGFFPVVEQLTALGVRFAAASGRQLDNLYRLFGPVARDMCFICENGALNAVGHEVVSVYPIERAMALEIIKTIQSYGMQVLLSGRHCCYVAAENRAFCDTMVYDLRNTMAIVDRFDLIEDDFIKISAFAEGSIEPFAPRLSEKWGARLNAARSGREWFDFTVGSKGMGVRSLAQSLGVMREEIVAFGDNFNDESMFKQAGHPFLMEQANPALRKPGIRLCKKVLPVLQSIVNHGGELAAELT